VEDLVSADSDNPTEFNAARWALMEQVIGQYVWDNQVEYMKTTKKPRDMKVAKYINRIKFMNSCGKYFEYNVTKKTDL